MRVHKVKSFRKVFIKRLLASFFLPILLVFLFIAVVFYQKVNEDRVREAEMFTSLLSGYVNEQINKFVAIVETLAQHDKIITLDYTVAEPFLVDYLDMQEEGMWSHFIVANQYGTEQVHTDGGGKHGISIAREDCFEIAWNEDKTYVGEPMISKSTGRSILSISTPIYRGEKKVGVLIGFVYLDYLSEILNKYDFTEDNFVIMLNQDGLVSGHQDKEQVLNVNYLETDVKSEKEKEIYLEMTQQKQGSRNAKYEDLDCNFTYRPIGVSGLSICLITPFVQMYDTLIYLLLGLCLSLLCIFILCFWNAGSVSRNLAKLLGWMEGETRKLSMGNTQLEVDRVAYKKTLEVRSLMELLHKLASNLSHMFQKMDEESKALFGAVEQAENINQTSNENLENIIAVMEEFASGIENTYSNIEDMEGRAKKSCEYAFSIAKYAQEGSELASNIKEGSNYDLAQMEENIRKTSVVIEKMQCEIERAIRESQKVDNIQSFVKEIIDISLSTKILSLNASIEATRAGAAGKSFAVVASQIGELAEKTERAAANINLISDDVLLIIHNLTDSSKEILEFMNGVVIKNNESFLDTRRKENQNIQTMEEILIRFYNHAHGLQEEFSLMSDGIIYMTQTMQENKDGIDQITSNTSQLSVLLQEMLEKVVNCKEAASELQQVLSEYQEE